MAGVRDFITVFILDAKNGRPADRVETDLSLTENGKVVLEWRENTKDDGRIDNWEPAGREKLTPRDFQNRESDVDLLRWNISIDLLGYFGDTFAAFPRFETFFYTKPGQGHCHISLFVAPFGVSVYYRGQNWVERSIFSNAWTERTTPDDCR